MAENYNSRNGSLWVQPAGPNSEPFFLGCHDLDDVEEPITGGVSLIRRFDPKGRGWLTTGKNRTPPDPVSTTITGLLFEQRDWLEKLKCPFTLFSLFRDCGDADVFLNYNRGYALMNCEPLSRTFSGFHMREEEVESAVAMEINADIPLVQINPLVIDRITTAAVLAANAVWTNKDSRCYGDCGETLDPGDLVAWGLDSAAGPATADLFLSADGGPTNAATAADPLGAGMMIGAVSRFYVDKTTRRILVAGGVAAGQGTVAWSDDDGATWTTVAIGGAAANHSPLKGSSLFVLDQYNIWLGTQGGYIYKSTDGGETWTAVESGVITTDPWNAVHFSDKFYGVAVSDSDVIAVTADGGTTWTAVTATGGGADILSAFRIDKNRMWVGDSVSGLYYTRDNGVTWTEKTGQAFNAGTMNDLEFANELIGFLISNTAGPVGEVFRTIDGGFSWQSIDTPTNTGLNDLMIADADTVFAVGEAQGGTAVVLKIHTTD